MSDDYWDTDYEDDLEENEEYERDLYDAAGDMIANAVVVGIPPAKLQFTLVGDEEGQNITVFQAGSKPLVAHSTHPNFESIKEGVLANDLGVLDLFDIALTAGTKFNRLTDRVTTANGYLYLDGEKIDNSLSEQVNRFIEEGVEDWKPLVAFFENVQANPNEHSKEQLFDWLTEQNFTITEDGMLVGYKGITKDYDGNLVSVRAGTAISDGVVVEGQVPNPVGAIVEMPRTEVMHNPVADCDAGLHVGSYEYARSYGTVMIEVEVNPRDVVSVPDSGWKLRTCRYKVVGVLADPDTSTEDEGEYTKPIKVTKTQKVKNAAKKAFKGDPTVRVGDVYEDTDKRRAGRTVKVTSILGGVAHVKSQQTDKESGILIDRLASRKYKRIKRGRKN